MEGTKNIPVSVYAEMTPNPATMKFVANKWLMEGGAMVEYTDPEQTKDSPLAARLFNFPFVTGIFITGNYISISKNDLVEWQDVNMEIRDFITDYLKTGNPVLKQMPAENKSGKPSDEQSSNITLPFIEPKTETEMKIVEVLEEYIRPAVEQDGGAIHFKSFEDGKCTVILRGACSGCPSSMITLKAGIEGLFQRMIPEVKEVVAEED